MAKTRPDRPPGPAPDRSSLHEAALRHLSRFAATQAGLVRVLDRRILRWARDAGATAEDVQASYALAREVARELAASGAIDDASFAATRTRRLLRTGRSRRAVAAHLIAKGVDPALAGEASPGPEAEFLAAVAFVRRRRIGPFRAGSADGHKELAVLARAGFPRDVAERVLRIGTDEAERLLLALKQG